MFQAKLTPTAAGRALLAKAQQGAEMKFTEVHIGSGILGSTDPDTLTDVITQVKVCPITSVSRQGEKTYVKFVFTQDNTTAYYLREMALMAQDPDAGDIAYMYANDGENAEIIPIPGATAYEREITIVVTLSNVESVTVDVQSGAYAGKKEFEEHITDNERHVTAAERTAWNEKVGLKNGKIPPEYIPELNKPTLQELSGTLEVKKGGTGRTTWSKNRILYASGDTTLGQTAFPAADGAILRQDKEGAPYWTTAEELAASMGMAKIASGSFSGIGEGVSQVALGTFLKTARKIILPFTPKLLITNPVGPRTTYFTSSVLRQGSSGLYGVMVSIGETEVYIAQHLLGNTLYVGGRGNYGADIAGEQYEWVIIA